MVSSFESVSANEFFFLSHSAADKLLNLKYLILPAIGCLISVAASFIIKHDERLGEKIGFTVLKYVVAFILIISFAVGTIILLPQFPDLASNIFNMKFI